MSAFSLSLPKLNLRDPLILIRDSSYTFVRPPNLGNSEIRIALSESAASP